MLAAVLLPRRAVPSLAIVVALAPGAASLVASREVRHRSQTERERTFAGAPVDWIDAAGERDVALLADGRALLAVHVGAALLERIGQERDQASWSRLSRCRAPGARNRTPGRRAGNSLRRRSRAGGRRCPRGHLDRRRGARLAARVVRAGGHGPVASRAATPHVASDHGSQAGRRSPRRRSRAHRGVRLPARQAAPHPSREAGPSHGFGWDERSSPNGLFRRKPSGGLPCPRRQTRTARAAASTCWRPTGSSDRRGSSSCAG